MDFKIINKIEKYSDDEMKRIKFSITLNEILCPVQCVLANINPYDYYNLFKILHTGKVKRLRELEQNFEDCPMDLF